MKTLSPLERVGSAGNARWWTALIAVASIGCLPLFSVLADQNNKKENKGGGNKAPSSHQSAPHSGGVSKAPNMHPGGNHTVNTPRPGGNHMVSAPRPGGNHVASNPHPGGNHIVSTQHSRSNHTVSAPKAVNAHQNRNNGGGYKKNLSPPGEGNPERPRQTTTFPANP